MNTVVFGLSCFVLGMIASIVPQQIQQYLYRKHLEKLGADEMQIVDDAGFPMDEEDIREQEKKEEENYGFFS